MIPLRLRVRNFMCYRDAVPPLSLEGIHLACLCGDNGAGKSALLDAMTWSLWGKSRADSDDELVHEGQTDMEVDFEFRSQGQDYRVLRKHARGPAGRSGTLLALQVASNGAFNDISGNTKTETQQKIIGILRLDYKTFRNSAYLVQGRANEFTVADPAERKKVLAAILDLSQYDELSDLAKTKAVEKGNLASRLQDIIARLDSELADKSRCEVDLVELQSLKARIGAERAEAESRLATFQRQLQELEIKQGQVKELGTRRAEMEADLARWLKRTAELAAEISEYQKTEEERPAIEAGHGNFLLVLSCVDYRYVERFLDKLGMTCLSP